MNAPVVLHFIETAIPGGAESMLIDLCRGQQAAGLRPMIGAFGHAYFARHCRDLGIEEFSLPDRSRFKRLWTLPLFAREFAKRIAAARVTLLHSHLFGPIVGGSLAARLAGVPHVGTLHDIHMIEDAPSRIAQLNLALLLGSHLVAVSDQMRGYYQQRLWSHRNRVHRIHNGITPPLGVSPASANELGVPAGHRVAILVGRIVPLKRVQDALTALQLALREHQITLLVVGEGPELAAMRDLTGQLGIADNVRFLGARQDVPALLRAADVFVQCSQTEGLSMSIIEALHAGLPCIVTDVGGNRELVQHERNGAVVAVQDPAAIASWLVRLCKDENLRAGMGERSRQIALNDFTLQSCVDRYSELYRHLGLRSDPSSSTADLSRAVPTKIHSER